jgi:hypothetical protein
MVTPDSHSAAASLPAEPRRWYWCWCLLVLCLSMVLLLLLVLRAQSVDGAGLLVRVVGEGRVWCWGANRRQVQAEGAGRVLWHQPVVLAASGAMIDYAGNAVYASIQRCLVLSLIISVSLNHCSACNGTAIAQVAAFTTTLATCCNPLPLVVCSPRTTWASSEVGPESHEQQAIAVHVPNSARHLRLRAALTETTRNSRVHGLLLFSYGRVSRQISKTSSLHR